MHAAPRPTAAAADEDRGPDLSRITDAILRWLDQLCAPLQIFYATPMRMRFASNLRAHSSLVWQHAGSVAGINEEMAPFMRMRFPEVIAMPPEVKQHARRGAGALPDSLDPRSLHLNSLLHWSGTEEVEGLESTPSVALLCSCTLMLFGILPIDRHELGLENVWRERHVGEAAKAQGRGQGKDGDEDSEPVVAGFEEASHSFLQREWWHGRTVSHVPAEAVAATSSSASAAAAAPSSSSSYTSVVDEVSITPRSCFLLFFPFIFACVWLLFSWRHYRLRGKFGAHSGPAAAVPSFQLHTKAVDAFDALAVPTAEEQAAAAEVAVTFVPPASAAAQYAEAREKEGKEESEGEEDPESFEVVERPAIAAAANSRKKK